MENSPYYTIDDYHYSLSAFDKVVCEASAVSNKTADRFVEHYKGYSSHIFTRICIHAQALISALPKSRWAKRDYECWDFSLIAGHVRALMEGFLLFMYLSEKPKSEDEWYIKLNIMHLNDCTRRIKLHENIRNEKEELEFKKSQEEIRTRLKNTELFYNFNEKQQKQFLSGKVLMIPTRDELLLKLGADIGEFNAFYDLVSNYTHILPISYYRNELNGRGTGVYNRTDLSYIILSLIKAIEILSLTTNRMVELFPDASIARKGKKSKFTMGPRENTKNRKVNT